MPDLGWSEYIRIEEEHNELACYKTALKNGKTPNQADNCNNGSVGCKDCPFIKHKKKLDKI